MKKLLKNKKVENILTVVIVASVPLVIIGIIIYFSLTCGTEMLIAGY